MIINGGCRCNGAFFSKHFMNGEKNLYVKVTDMRGLASKNIGSAFREMKAVADGTRCKNFFYHANINPREDEKLTAEQWDKAVDTLEKRLGLEGQARFIIEHEKKGRVHRHIIWSRIDIDKMRAIPNDDDFEKHQAVARQLEKEFGLSHIPSVLGEDIEKGKRPERRPETWEVFRGERNGISVFDIKKEVTELWNSFDKAEDFTTALKGKGYLLARGDSRNFCIVDRNGDVHSLARRIEGVKAADVREKLEGINLDELPSVKDATALQREQAEKENAPEEPIRADAQQQPSTKDEDNRHQQALGEDNQTKDSLSEQFKGQADRQAEIAAAMEAQQQRFESYKESMRLQAEEARRQEERRNQIEKEGRAREGEVRNPNYRYGQALAQHYDVRDPYGSLARSAMAEYGSFLRDRENLERQISRTADPTERQKLELRKEIEAADYMAITSQRIAGQSEVFTGRLNSPEAVNQRAKAEYFQKQSQKLRREYREIATQGLEEKERAGSAEKKAPSQDKPALMVEERTPGQPKGEERKLVDFVKTLPEKPHDRQFTKDEIRNDPEAKRAHFTQQKDDKNRTLALENISRNLKTGKNLNTNDIARLRRDDLDGIKKSGDSHLKEIVKQHEKEREQGRGLER